MAAHGTGCPVRSGSPRERLVSLNSGSPFMLTRRDSALGKAVRAFAEAIGEPRPTAVGPVPAGSFVPAFG